MNKSIENRSTSMTILMAEDDADDSFLLGETLRSLGCSGELRLVEDGIELMDYLYHRGRFADPKTSPLPGLILLDLNMPKKDGRQALVEIKSDPTLKGVPVVIWTTSDLPEDKAHCKKAGANDYVTKPNSYTELEETVRVLCQKWLQPRS